MLAGWCGAICRRASNRAMGGREAFLRGAKRLATRPRRWDNPESLHQPEQIGLAPALDQLTAFVLLMSGKGDVEVSRRVCSCGRIMDSHRRRYDTSLATRPALMSASRRTLTISNTP